MATVTIYTTPTCTYCRAAKQFFTDHNIAYSEVNAAGNQEAIKFIVENTHQMGVPVIVVEKDGAQDIVVGFDQPKLAELLGVA